MQPKEAKTWKQFINKANIKKLVKWFGKGLSFLSLAFVFYAIWKLGLDFGEITNIRMFLLVLAGGVLGKTLTVFLSGSVWLGWVQFFSGERISLREGYRVFTRANIGKYLPGNVMQYIGRNLYADKMGVSQKKIALSSVLEVVSLTMVALLTAMLFARRQLVKAVQAVFQAVGERGLMIAAASFLVLLVAVIIAGLYLWEKAGEEAIKKIRKRFRRYYVLYFLRNMLFSMLKHAVVLMTLGWIFYLIYRYMGGEGSYRIASRIIAAYMIAWVLGFIVPGAPGGIGIREMVLTLLLGGIAGGEIIPTIALIHRLITIIGDFAAYLVGMLLGKIKADLRDDARKRKAKKRLMRGKNEAITVSGIWVTKEGEVQGVYKDRDR